MNTRYHLPDDGPPPLAAWLRMALLTIILAVLAYAAARGQSVMVPCYEPGVAVQATQQCPKGKEKSLILIMNVNSGPHWFRDGAYGRAVDAARAKGIKLAFYVDAIAGADYSPVVTGAGRVWKLTNVREPRDKTAAEMRAERDAWLAFYGVPDFWFIDDIRARHTNLFAELATWKGRVILNPGTAMTWPAALPKCWVIIHESESGWPRKLTRGEESSRSRCGVLGLSLSAGALDRFIGSTAGMALRYASPLTDAEGAYNKLPSYFTRLFP